MKTPVEDTSASEPARPILLAKTVVPPVRSDTVDRPHLLARPEHAATPITVVAAPAGWGKTTLLAQYARARSHRSAGSPWMPPTTIITGFWAYLITSLGRAGADVGESALAALQVPGLDPVEVALSRLLNDLTERDLPLTLILDDFHLIADSQIGEEVEYFINYLPPGVQVVAGTRLDPPLPLALWRGQGLLTEIENQRRRK